MISLFQNHDDIKLIVQYPVFFNLIIVCSTYFLLKWPASERENSAELFPHDITTELKGLAIWAIILSHLCRHTIADRMQLAPYYDIGFIGVGIFLFLSGYGVAESEHSSGLDSYWKKRVVRIYLPVVLFNSIWLLLDAALLGKYPGLPDSIMAIFGYVIIDRNYWYIRVLFFLYFFFYFLASSGVTGRAKHILLWMLPVFLLTNPSFLPVQNNALGFSAGLAAASNKTAVAQLIQRLFAHTYSVVGLLVVGIGLYITALFAKQYSLNAYLAAIHFFLVIGLYLRACWRGKATFYLVPCLIILSYYYFTNSSICVKLQYSISSIFITAGLAIAFVRRKKVSIFFSFLGRMSLELFLLHGAFMYTYDFILFRWPLVVSFPIYMAMLIGVSFVANIFFQTLYRILTLGQR